MQPVKEEFPLKAWSAHEEKVGLHFAGKISSVSVDSGVCSLYWVFVECL